MKLKENKNIKFEQKDLSEVGFEPTPSERTRMLRRDTYD